MPLRAVPMSLLLLVSCAAADPSGSAVAVTTQFAFTNFQDDRVTVEVDGRTVFDQSVTVAADNERNGLAAVAQIDLPECAEVVVIAKQGRIAERLCRTAATKSVLIDGGPPLSIQLKDEYQGLD